MECKCGHVVMVVVMVATTIAVVPMTPILWANPAHLHDLEMVLCLHFCAQMDLCDLWEDHCIQHEFQTNRNEFIG